MRCRTRAQRDPCWHLKTAVKTAESPLRLAFAVAPGAGRLVPARARTATCVMDPWSTVHGSRLTAHGPRWLSLDPCGAADLALASEIRFTACIQ